MSETFSTSVIATAATLIGVIITALLSWHAARQKITELEITYQQKLQSDYLGNARAYTHSLYVPLSVTLHRLSDAYRAFRNRVDLDNAVAPREADDEFRAACARYQEEMRTYQDRGASAFLTIDLEERLLSFDAFLVESLLVETPVTKRVIEHDYHLRLGPFDQWGFRRDQQVVLPLKKARSLPRGPIGFGVGFVGVNVRVETLAAPIASRDFEARILRDLTGIKALVKEVTLGAHRGA